MNDFSTVKVERNGSVSTVTLNRPEVRNAFHPTMIQELTEVFARLAVDEDISVVVLRGAGKSFCAGADLFYMQSMAEYSLEQNRADSEALFGMFWALRSLPQPVVGLVHGHAMGGALGLVALCDVAAAVSGTQFCFSEVRLGLAPAVISPFVLEKVTNSFAHRYFLTAEVFGAEEALKSGLLQFSGEWTETEKFLETTIRTVLNNGPQAMRATKRLLRKVTADSVDWNQRREVTTAAIAQLRVSDEGQEGLRGFLEKRSPSWKPEHE